MAGVIRCIRLMVMLCALSVQAVCYAQEQQAAEEKSFSGLGGVAVDGKGNLYVTDGDAIRKVTPRGVVTTVAGTAADEGHVDGEGAAARFNNPGGVTIDRVGNLYVADRDTVRKITPAGEVRTVAGTAGVKGHADGTGAAASFDIAIGITADSENDLYVIDRNAIRKITPSGVVTTLAGKGDVAGYADGVGEFARFNHPRGIATDRAGNVYVADSSNSAIRKIRPDGKVITLSGSPNLPGHADGARGVASFVAPYGIAVDGAGNIYVADNENCNIRKISPAGRVSTLAGIPWESETAKDSGVMGYADGTGEEAAFWYPRGIAVDSAGNIYVADSSNSAIRKVTPSGVVTTFARPGFEE